ncbi:hypothetical protein GT347_18285 [Xylophilus rhododendri]|uniref:Uncharacterized protein n=1 Tax=Xylophilus rhododendri TaxID=2697032 RepID=A0A857J6Y3_9BURK|nr:hypothetical protein [Xylophilus rhododendri]QHI99754.1 hypothetical protein GT347_18285 [Xylophilus rhododendri]
MLRYPVVTESQKVVVALRRAAARPGQYPALTDYTLDRLENARSVIAEQPDSEQLLKALEHELEARRSLHERSAGALLKNIPAGAHAPIEQPALAEVFRSPQDPADHGQVAAFIEHALEQGTITAEMVEAIRFFETLAFSQSTAPMLAEELERYLAQAPTIDLPVIARLYQVMSPQAAGRLIGMRMKEQQAGCVGQTDLDKVYKMLALRLLEGKDALCSDPLASHTLAYALTQRIGQIFSLPGGDRLSMDELAQRAAYGLRSQAFLLDAGIALYKANGD